MNPELSVVIPTLNEAAHLPALLADLAAQREVAIEALVSDGGSNDATSEIAVALMRQFGLAGTVVIGEAGRGRQLNRGAALARAKWLLFLHADSRLPSSMALADALNCLRRVGDTRVAGHFALRFDMSGLSRELVYYRCEAKARIGLPGTIHGDQGFLLPLEFFRELEGFREDLPVLEDTLLAEKIRARGRWLLLPATIVTSPRRFLVEGFAVRQAINALLMNFAMTGWEEPIRRAVQAYPPQSRTRPLELAPFLRVVDACLAERSFRERLRIWYHTGDFVRANAWQAMLQWVARRAFAAGIPPEAVPLEPVRSFARCFDSLTKHPPARLAAALLTWGWFRTRRRKPAQGA